MGDYTMDFATALARLAADTRCRDVVLLDVRRRSPVTKFFLIVTGVSARQMRTACDEFSEMGLQNGYGPWRTSGYETAKWILIDFVDVVVHIFDEPSRRFYDLELLWGDCPKVPWSRETDAAEAPALADWPTPVKEIEDDIEAAIAAASDTVEELVEEQMMWNEQARDEAALPAESDVTMVEIQTESPARGRQSEAPPAVRPGDQRRSPAKKMKKTTPKKKHVVKSTSPARGKSGARKPGRKKPPVAGGKSSSRSKSLSIETGSKRKKT